MNVSSSLVSEIAGMLLESSLFSDFPAAGLRSVARYFGSSKVGTGDLIFKEGDAGTFMCIINSGDVSVI
jgi:CRP-like cAMP-binding protein